jgi:hypothetical protein
VAVPVVYTDSDGEYIAASYSISSANSNPTIALGDTNATSISVISSLSNSYNAPVDEDSFSRTATFSIATGNSTNIALSNGVNGLSITFNIPSPFAANTPLDEDAVSSQAGFNLVAATTVLRSYTDAELPTSNGGGGGPTTVQIWKTG